MKRRVLLLAVAGTLLLWTSAQAAVDFVTMGSAEMLIVTHDDLRTPNWEPGTSGAWETILLDQKAQQGISVAILDIGDDVSSSEIREIIEDSCGSGLLYLYVIGDADRQEVDAGDPNWPESDADSNRLVPFYGRDVDPEAYNVTHYPLENDLAYVDSLTGMDDVEVGRLPAQTRDEILLYLEKCDDYLAVKASSAPAWAKKQLMAFDDWSHPWVNCNGSEFRSWAYVLANEVPGDWTTDILLTSEDRNSQGSRDTVFANQVNDGYGLVFSLGVASHTNNLSYFQWGTSDFDHFNNDEAYPLLLGFNCSIGAIQRPDSCHYDIEHQPPIIDGIFWDYNVVEKLLFLEDAGIIGALAPTNWTIGDVDRYLSKKALDFLVDNNVHRFGSLWRRIVSLRDTSGGSTFHPVGDWHYENVVLLGDPSLWYPLESEASGHWTISMSPVIIMDSVHVPAGDSLVIDAGVYVLFDDGAALVVDGGAKLIVNGEVGDSVVFDAKDSGETWTGIFVNGSQLDVEYAKFTHVSSHAIHTEAPVGDSIPVSISHCCFNGSNVAYEYAVLRLWGSPSLTQKVSNVVVENSSNGNGMYLYNCHVDFDSVIVRNFSVVNSYVKKTTGSFRNCTFEGRASFYSILTNSATCTPDFKCCTFKNLSPTSGDRIGTVFCGGGTAPTFGGTECEYGVTNVFEDTSDYLLVIQGTGVLPIIGRWLWEEVPADGGFNDWYQHKNSGKFIQWRDAGQGCTAYCAQDQYWNPSPADSLFAPDSCFNYDRQLDSALGLCGGESGGSGGSLIWNPPTERSNATLDDIGSDASDSLGAAVHLENEGEYWEAQRICRTVALTTADPALRWMAVVHIVTTDVMLGSTSAWIPSLIDSLKNAEDAYSTGVLALRIMSSYRLNRGEFSAAIDTCMSLLNSGLTFTDSILVAIDLVGIQMAAGLRDLGGGNLDAAGTTPIPPRLRVMSDAHGLRLENELLRLMGSQSETDLSVPVPKEYRLYQNYPNPFNPNTEIRFDLPEVVRVQLKIYNILGQEVTTLIDETRLAGAHRIIWDSKSASGMQVASGVYIYQIKAGSFVDSKKMVLIR